jgi:hypothetical protein
VSYIGPGAPPFVRLNWRADEIRIRVGIGFFTPEWTGRLRNSHLATLSEPAPTHLPPGCGWSTRRLSWRVAPASRAPVTPENWTGTITVPHGGGTLSVKVSPSGRIVEDFSAAITCEAGSGHYEVGPSTVGEFISGSGSFEDAGRPASFHGRFLAGTLTGAVMGSFAGCGEGASNFTAHPG